MNWTKSIFSFKFSSSFFVKSENQIRICQTFNKFDNLEILKLKWNNPDKKSTFLFKSLIWQKVFVAWLKFVPVFVFLEISSTKKCRLHSEQNYFLRFLIVNTALKLDTVLKEGKWKSLFQRFSFDADSNWSTILHSKVWEQEKFFFRKKVFFSLSWDGLQGGSWEN